MPFTLDPEVAEALAVTPPPGSTLPPTGDVAPRIAMLESTFRYADTAHMLIAGPGHLHAVLDQYAVHYNQHRPHRARNLRPPAADETAPAVIADFAAPKIRRRRVLGGLINEYEQAA